MRPMTGERMYVGRKSLFMDRFPILLQCRKESARHIGNGLVPRFEGIFKIPR